MDQRKRDGKSTGPGSRTSRVYTHCGRCLDSGVSMLQNLRRDLPRRLLQTLPCRRWKIPCPSPCLVFHPSSWRRLCSFGAIGYHSQDMVFGTTIFLCSNRWECLRWHFFGKRGVFCLLGVRFCFCFWFSPSLFLCVF